MENNKKQSFMIIAVFSLGHFVHDVYTAFISPILPIIKEQYSLSYAALGLIPVVTRIPSILNPVIGFIVERYNLKSFLIISPFLTAFFICLMANASGYFVLLVFAFAVGISSSLFHVPAPVLLKKAAPRRTGTAMSSFQIGGELARTAGPIVVLFVVTAWGLKGLYYLLPVAVVIPFAFYGIFKHVPVEKHEVSHSVTGSIIQTIISEHLLFLGIFGILLQKSLTATVLRSFMPVYLHDKGNSLWFAGSSLSILQGAAVLGVLITGPVSDYIGKKKVLLVVTGITPLLMLFFTKVSGMFFFVDLILLGVFSFSSTPVILSLIQGRGFKYPAIANGIYMSTSFLLSSFSILFAGKLSDIFSIEDTFRWFSYASFIGLPFVFFIPKPGGSKGKGGKAGREVEWI